VPVGKDSKQERTAWAAVRVNAVGKTSSPGQLYPKAAYGNQARIELNK